MPADIVSAGEAKYDPNKTYVRLYACYTCRFLGELPDYPPPEFAPVANDAVLIHVDMQHGAGTEQPHNRMMFRILPEQWSSRKAKEGVIDQIFQNYSGFKPSYYDVKDQLNLDAVKCFNAHHRSVPCLDYKDSSKRIGNPSRSMREKLAASMPRSFHGDRDAIAKGGPVQYLCEFCPVQVTVDYAKRKARGEE